MKDDELSLTHYRMLRDGSGISDECIRLRPYKTITTSQELIELGFARAQARNVPGLLLPVNCTDGSNGLAVYRPDTPRIIVDKTKRDRDTGEFKRRVIKYELPPRAGVRLDCPPICRRRLADPTQPLWVTEGQKKADALASRGACVIALLGVWNFKGRNTFGGVTVLADFDSIGWKARDVYIVFDSDLMSKQSVRAALERLTEILQRKGAHVSAVYLPQVDGEKVGVDDYLLTHSLADLEALIEGPRPQAKPAPPQIELLEHEPLTIARPITLIESKAYCAVWPYVRVTVSESLDRDGNIIKLDQPLVTTERRPLVVREDGMIFTAGAAEDDTGFEVLEGLAVKLPVIPEDKHLWSTAGIKKFRAGERPEPAVVFQKVADVVSHYIDFDQSLADQRTMSEMVACYILATWFLDSFQVIGYLYPSGEFGSGKSELLNAVTQLAFMGEVVMAQSTIATIRDLADYGATLAFDEVERLQQDKTKSDIVAIMLAGNRRGASLAAKEPAGGDGSGWVTRRFNCFCPRLFAAVRLPDGALATRSIIVPLVRSIDPDKPKRMVTAVEKWPLELTPEHARRVLIDELWALACGNLSKLAPYDDLAASRSTLKGRQLEPWRAILAIATWLDECGAESLANRMHALAEAYQSESQELDATNMTVLVIRALEQLLEHNKTSSLFNAGDGDTAAPCFKTKDIAEEVRAIAGAEELPIDLDASKPGALERRVGWIMKRLRMPKAVRVGHTQARGWSVTEVSLERYKRAFGLTPDIPPSHEENGGKTSAKNLNVETIII